MDGCPTKLEDVEKVGTLGKGFFGEVFEAKEKGGAARTFAVKKVKLSFVAEHRLTEQLKNEISIMYKLQHPRIIKLYFDFKDETYIYLGMDLASGGTLFDKLNKARKFPSEIGSRYFAETCEALDYLHHMPEKIIHRDIKPENLLLDAEDSIKLADFGWANMLQGNLRDTFCGTLDYLAPEMITGTGHDESVDMWGMGVLMYELVTGQSPFGSQTKETTCRLILNVELRFPADVDPDAKDLVTQLCKKVPAERLDARGALNHVFVTKFRGAPAAGGGAAADEDEGMMGRPSVFARRIMKDKEKISGEMQLLLQSKQDTEEKLMSSQLELDTCINSLNTEKKEKKQHEAASEELKKGNAAREKEVADLRKRAEALEAEVSKLSQGKPKMSMANFFKRGGRGSTGAEA